NNAGGYFGTRTENKNGYEYTFAMNHLGHFLLTNLLLDNIKATPNARIVNVSSAAQGMGKINFDDIMAKQKYSGFRAYCQAKLANVVFSKSLAERLEGTTVTANAVHPGAVNTGFGAEAGSFFKFIMNLARPFLRSPDKGAKTSVHVASTPDLTVTGKYWADCKVKSNNKQADDPEVQRRLWDLSCELTGWSDN
ncbi:MAG: SDR family NAD(P)-dependent oxidoreductase, partial [Bacteroidota bacterium]